MSAGSREYRYHCDTCGYTYIGPQLAAGDPKRWCGACPRSAPLVGTPYGSPLSEIPLSNSLRATYTIAEAEKIRAQLASKWHITDKGHKHHGSNFSGNQTLLQIIKNLTEKVEGKAEIERVRMCVMEDYDYDILECRMVR